MQYCVATIDITPTIFTQTLTSPDYIDTRDDSKSLIVNINETRVKQRLEILLIAEEHLICPVKLDTSGLNHARDEKLYVVIVLL